MAQPSHAPTRGFNSVGGPRDLQDPDVQARIPYRFIKALEDNTDLHDCCRDMSNYTVEWFQSPDEKAPDMIVFTCGDCGRRQRRLGAGGTAAPNGTP